MWRERMTPEEVAEYEAVAGDMLVELGYELASEAGASAGAGEVRRRRPASPADAAAFRSRACSG